MTLLTSWVSALPRLLAQALALALLAVTLIFYIRGWTNFRRCMQRAGEPDQTSLVIRAFRAWILAAGFLSFAAGVYFRDGRWIAFALIFLFEEIIETGIMLLAARRR